LSDGRAAFQIAVEAMVEAGRAALALAKCDLADVDWWIPHQANARIIEAARLRLGIDTDRTALSIADLGNSSAASIAVTYARLVERGAIRGGQLVLMTAVGAGFTSGGVVFKAT
jgi:3-oxoacyl-[acyl-carrier-protein] synthase-3